MNTDKRFINDVKDIYDTNYGWMGINPPDDWEIEQEEYLLLGTAYDQDDAEEIVKKLNEFNQFKLDVTEVLNKNYHYALKQSREHLNNATLYAVYKLMLDTFKLIADEIGVEIIDS